MTEEELARELGLQQTWQMKFARWKTISSAPHESQTASNKFVAALTRYQQLGETEVEKKDDRDSAKAKAQVALILLSASIRRDISAFNPSYVEYRLEDLNDAFNYAWNMQFSEYITDAIQRLIAV